MQQDQCGENTEQGESGGVQTQASNVLPPKGIVL